MPARRFVWVLALCVGLLSVTPFLYGLAHTPPGSRYIGFQYNTDDEMVYAAWMRQAMNGHFLMDNRFAIDPQPGLTIHLYFFVLGLVARVVGIPWAAALARFLFGGLFVLLLNRLIGLLGVNEAYRKIALLVGCFGAGFGFLVWQPLGVDFGAGSTSPLKGAMLGHLPNDVWQPEGFVFPSLLTNSLFSFSLCLIVGIFLCVLATRNSWKPVAPGALGMLVLMNVHSYDVLLIALVLVGLLITTLAQRQLSFAWLARVVVIGLGAVPSALWFLYVLKHDAVFQARADTLTYTENFRSVLGGYGLLMLFAGIGGVVWLRHNSSEKRTLVGMAVLAATVVALWICASSHAGGYWMGLGAWCGLFVLGLVIVGLLGRPNPAQSLILSWAVLGLITPYFPGLFERKLMMGLSVPWAILGGAGIYLVARSMRGGERRMVAALCTVLVAATSVRWIGREFELINKNDSNTTLHPVYLSPDAVKIVDYLNQNVDDHRVVVLAMPGVPGSLDDVVTPFYPDLNPILSGFTGVYTYAGHWSETPDYTKRRKEASAFFLNMTDDQRQHIMFFQPDYFVAPAPGKLAELDSLLKGPKQPYKGQWGGIVVDGKSTVLIGVNRL